MKEFPSALLLLFIALKLCKVIDWTWFWVLSPFWISCIIVIPVLLIAFLWGVFDDDHKRH